MAMKKEMAQSLIRERRARLVCNQLKKDGHSDHFLVNINELGCILSSRAIHEGPEGYNAAENKHASGAGNWAYNRTRIGTHVRKLAI